MAVSIIIPEIKLIAIVSDIRFKSFLAYSKKSVFIIKGMNINNGMK